MVQTTESAHTRQQWALARGVGLRARDYSAGASGQEPSTFTKTVYSSRAASAS